MADNPDRTVLVYLNSCIKSGGTTFPLAQPISDQIRQLDGVYAAGPGSFNSMVRSVRKPDSMEERPISEGQLAAEQLIYQHNIQHTRISKDGSILQLGKAVEDIATALYNDPDSALTGIRVLPRQGHVCIFSGLTEDGWPNPNSYHGGEVVCRGESKDILTFFFEIPEEAIQTRQDFAEQVVQRERTFMQRHL